MWRQAYILFKIDFVNFSQTACYLWKVERLKIQKKMKILTHYRSEKARTMFKWAKIREKPAKISLN